MKSQILQQNHEQMIKQVFTIKELLALNFIELERGDLDKHAYYRWFRLKKNECEIDVTYEFDVLNKFTSGHVHFNYELLKGRTITKKDIKLLIEIM